MYKAVSTLIKTDATATDDGAKRLKANDQKLTNAYGRKHSGSNGQCYCSLAYLSSKKVIVVRGLADRRQKMKILKNVAACKLINSQQLSRQVVRQWTGVCFESSLCAVYKITLNFHIMIKGQQRSCYTVRHATPAYEQLATTSSCATSTAV
eukprot:944796-Pleurochrysis_carterae.AAC.1